MTEQTTASTFETNLPLIVYVRPMGDKTHEWTEFDQGPGEFSIPMAFDVYLRVKNIRDDELYSLVKAVTNLPGLTYLNLSENRNITDLGLSRLTALPKLTRLNLSSCNITNGGLPHLAELKKLEYLDLSYCNRISDEGLRALKSMTRLVFLDLQGCVKTSLAGIRKIERRGLTIHR